MPWEEGPQAEGPCPLSGRSGDMGDLGAPMGFPGANARLTYATPQAVLGYLCQGWQADAGELQLGSLLTAELTDAAGTWAPQLMEWKSSPARVYSRLHWAAPNRCKWYFLQRNSLSTGQLIYSPAETLGLTLAQIFQWMVSSKLSNKGFLNHVGVVPLSKKTAARGPLSRYVLGAALRTTTSGCTPERQSMRHCAELKGGEQRHGSAPWEQQRWAAPRGQASQKPRVNPKEAMPLLVGSILLGLSPAGRAECLQQLQARQAVNAVQDPGQKDTVQKAGLEISYEHGSEQSIQEISCLQCRSKIHPENKDRERTGDQYSYTVAQVRTEGPGPS